MRRRPAATDVPVPPPELVAFTAGDWPVVPEPSWWAERAEPYPWPLACRRLAWQRARRAWINAQRDPAAARAELPGPGPVVDYS